MIGLSRRRLVMAQFVWMVGFVVPSVVHSGKAHAGPINAKVPSAVLAPEFSGSIAKNGAAELLDQAIERFLAQDQGQALQLLALARKKSPPLPPSELMLARLCFATGQASRGRALLDEASFKSPAFAGIYVEAGNLALREDRRTDAIVQFEKGLTLVAAAELPAELKSHYRQQASLGLAAVAEHRGDWKNTQHWLEAVLQLEPNNGRARYILARALFEQGQAALAYEQFELAARTDATLDAAEISMAWLCDRGHDPQRAKEWMTKAVERWPNSARVRRSMAMLLLQAGEASQALVQAEAALQHEPASREMKYLLGMVLRSLRDWPRAERVFQELFLTAPADYTASDQLALALVEQASPVSKERARQLAEINSALYPKSAEVLTVAGWVHYRLGRVDEAERELTTARSLGGTSETAYYLAHVLRDRGKVEEAVRLLEAAVTVPGVFVFRKEATEWLARMRSEVSKG